jgi:hypothetical protein
LLQRALEKAKAWPVELVVAFMDDLFGPRYWAEHESAAEFVANITTAFPKVISSEKVDYLLSPSFSLFALILPATHTHEHTDAGTHRNRDLGRHRHICGYTHTHTHTHTHTNIYEHTPIRIQIRSETQRHRHTDTQAYRHTPTHISPTIIYFRCLGLLQEKREQVPVQKVVSTGAGGMIAAAAAAAGVGAFRSILSPHELNTRCHTTPASHYNWVAC